MERIDNIYSQFCDEIKRVETFLHTTQASYIITDTMLPQYSTQDINGAKKQLHSITNRDKMSYCAADRKVEEVELVCEWVSVEEYAEKEHTDITSVQHMVENNMLGSVLQKDGVTYIVWPPSEQKREHNELPELGKKLFHVKVSQTGVSTAVISDPSMELSLALTNQTPDSMQDFMGKANTYLHELCFTSIWSAFEVFIKRLIYVLIEIDPHKMFAQKKIANKTMSYLDIFQKSSELSSIEDLKNYIVSLVIAEQEDGHQSIHSLINLIKDCYLQGSKPYDTWYVFNGEKKQTSYSVLLTVKDARNSLMHDVLSEQTDNPASKESFNAINEQTYTEYVLILRAIADNIVSLLRKKLST